MKFLFGDKVKVINGFYKDSIGVVTDYCATDSNYYFEGGKYGDPTFASIKHWIPESDLQLTGEK